MNFRNVSTAEIGERFGDFAFFLLIRHQAARAGQGDFGEQALHSQSTKLANGFA